MINAQQALAALEKAVEHKGAEYVYMDAATGIQANTPDWHEQALTCRYADMDGNPACIVGTALALSFPEDFERWRAQESASGGFPVWLGNGDGCPDTYATFDEGAEDVMTSAQRKQDDGATWGEALEVARKAVAA